MKRQITALALSLSISAPATAFAGDGLRRVATAPKPEAEPKE